MVKATALEPWSYSLDGFTVRTAAPGETLELPEHLARDGAASGHLDVEEPAQWNMAPEKAADLAPDLETAASPDLDAMTRAELQDFARANNLAEVVDLRLGAGKLRDAIRKAQD